MMTYETDQVSDEASARVIVTRAIANFTTGRDMDSEKNRELVEIAVRNVTETLVKLYPDAGDSLVLACLDYERSLEEADGAGERSELLRDFALRCMRTGQRGRGAAALQQAGTVTHQFNPDVHDDNQRVVESTMLGDLMRVLLAQVRNLDKPWGELREHRQQAVLTEWEEAIERAIVTACRHIAERGVDAVRTTLEKVTTQGGKVVAQLAVPPRTEGLHDLVDAAVATAEVLVVLPADIEAWNGGELPRATPDQLDLETEANRKAAEEEARAGEELEAWTPEPEDWVIVLTDTRCRETDMVLEVGDTAIVQSVDEGVVGVELDDKRGLVYLDQGTLGPFDPDATLGGAAVGSGSAPLDLAAGDVVLVGANEIRGTVLEVHPGHEVTVETELGGKPHASRVSVANVKRPGGGA